MLLVVSETGLVYTFTTEKLQPLVTNNEGRNLIHACLKSSDGIGPDGQPIGPLVGTKGGKNGGLSIRPHKLSAEASKAMLATAAQVAGATPDEAAAHAEAQTRSMAAIGNGTPVAQRPKKRLPSKKRSASQPNLSTDIPTAPDVIPPVPPIPDMHRQSSPTTHMGMPHPQQHPNPLQSPLSGAYHMGMPSPNAYPYPPPTPSGPSDYATAPLQYGYPQQTGHPGFLVHPGMYQQPPPHPQQQDDRRMMQGPPM